MTAPGCDPNEDHEKYAGEVILDPWEDPEQTDWPMNPEGGADGDKLGDDEGNRPLA
jgi:hypothetical protein